MQIIKFAILGVAGAIASFFSIPYVANLAPRVGLNIETNESGTPYTLLSIVGALFGLVLFLFRSTIRSFLSSRSRVVAWLAFFGGMIYGLLCGDSDVIGAAILFTPAAASVGDNNYSFTIPFCPQFISFGRAAAPTQAPAPPIFGGNLTNLRVEVAGKGTITNVPTNNQLMAVGMAGQFGTDANIPSNRGVRLTFPTGDGTLKNFSTTISYSVNYAAAPPASDIISVYGSGVQDANVTVLTQPVTVLERTGVAFSDFYRIFFPLVTTPGINDDVLQVTYRNGFTQQYTVHEFLALTFYQYASPIAQPVIDNSDATIKEVYYNPVAQRSLIIQKFIPV